MITIDESSDDCDKNCLVSTGGKGFQVSEDSSHHDYLQDGAAA